mmetsp:Transcript_65089/g.149053  ORF Transcript_65089/g.149053 Transcript_65089/m.149053 type:complete len:289 (+) Transcript_65089:347-1213(+)
MRLRYSCCSSAPSAAAATHSCSARTRALNSSISRFITLFPSMHDGSRGIPVFPAGSGSCIRRSITARSYVIPSEHVTGSCIKTFSPANRESGQYHSVFSFSSSKFCTAVPSTTRSVTHWPRTIRTCPVPESGMLSVTRTDASRYCRMKGPSNANTAGGRGDSSAARSSAAIAPRPRTMIRSGSLLGRSPPSTPNGALVLPTKRPNPSRLSGTPAPAASCRSLRTRRCSKNRRAVRLLARRNATEPLPGMPTVCSPGSPRALKEPSRLVTCVARNVLARSTKACVGSIP